MKLKRNKLFLSIVPVLSFAFLATVLGVSVVSPVNDTSATDPTTITFNVIRPAFMLTLSVSPTVTLDIEPTPTGTMTVASSVVSAATTSPSGYTLYLEMTGTNATSNSLIHSTNDNFELTSSGTFTNPVALTDGTWGYAIEHEAESVYNINGFDASYATMESATPTSAKFAAVPTSNRPAQRIAETDEVGGVDVTVYYGVRADYETASGAYTNKVLYTAIADDGATPVMIVSPNSLSGLAGESVSLVTSMYTTADIDTDAYILTRAQYNAVVGGTLDITTLTSQKMTCSRDTTSDPFALNCTTVAAADGAGYIYLDIPRYGTHFATPVAINAPEFFTISSMQEMTPAICNSVATPTSANVTTIVNLENLYAYTGTGAEVPEITLADTRGSQPYKTYKVRKLADGNCWMTENLALSDATLTSSDSNLPSGASFTLPASDSTGWCGAYSSTCVDTPRVLDSGETNYGMYYNWSAATAGTGTYSVESGEVMGSVCPKGWKLPSANTDYGVLQNLYSNYNSASAMQSVNGPNFVLSGYSNVGNISNQGTDGRFWSSTAYSSDYAYRMFIDNSSVAFAHGSKYNGFAVRCVATGFYTITAMQDMTNAVCGSATTPTTSAAQSDTTGAHTGDSAYVPQRTLSDIRDGETYRIRKLADGNCWMTENLRLTLTAGQSIEISDGTTWLPTNYDGTTTGATTFTAADATTLRLAPGNGGWKCSGVADNGCVKIIRSFNTVGSEGANICDADGAAASTQTPGTDPCYETSSTLDGEVQQNGVYYNWYTATAGQGLTNSNAVPAVSICPRNWELPRLDNANTHPSYRYLTSVAYGIAFDTVGSSDVRVFPFSFVFSGIFAADNASPSSQNLRGRNMTSNSARGSSDNQGTYYNVAVTDFRENIARGTSNRKRNGNTIRCAIKGV